MAEFWADGPKSETPPGHWNTLANAVADSPGVRAPALRQGRAARSARVGRARVPRAQRRRARRGDRRVGHQAAHADGAPALARALDGRQGAVVGSEGPVVRSRRPAARARASSRSSRRRAARRASGTRTSRFFVGQIAVRNWLGEPGDRAKQVSGVGWVRAVDWITYQRRTFVTPAFPGVHLGAQHVQPRGRRGAREPHGEPVFPGRPRASTSRRRTRSSRSRRARSTEVRLQWASYFDASDEAGQSRLWGSIHIAPDDFAGRRVGHQVGLDAVLLATKYFDGKP